MNTQNTLRLRAGLLLAALLSFVCVSSSSAADTPRKMPILCTTFPVWLLTRNITHGSDRVEVKLLIAAQMGCPHDYALTPQDMQKLATARVLVVNGLGLEEFLGAPLKKANETLKLVDASHDIPAAQLLKYNDGHHADEGDHAKGSADAEKPGAEASTKEHAQAHGHEGHAHTGINPHLFASPRLYGQMGLAIAKALAEADPADAALYEKNAKAYATKMAVLTGECAAAGTTLANNRIVTQHGVFDYLAADMGLKVVAVVAAHAGQEPSAAEMLDILKEIKEEQAGAIFTEPQYPARIGQTIAREAGIKTATLDPVASGPENAPLDYYETVMRANLQTLKQTLGAR